VALRDSMVGVARVLARDWTPGDRTRTALREEVLREGVGERSGDPAGGIRERILRVVGAGQTSRTFVLRLMACIGVAGLVSEVLPLQRSYWVPLTVAIVLKPDYGSVFARAVSQVGLSGTPVPASLELPDDETLQPITEAVRALLGVLASGERLGSGALASFVPRSSGWPDLNRRPPRPKRGALAKLRYSPS
jgi:hypothetical protein